VLGFDVVPPCTSASECHTGAVQSIRHRAVVYPKLCTDPAERPTGGIELGRSVHIHDQTLISGESRQPLLATIVRGFQSRDTSGTGVKNLICGSDRSPVVGEEFGGRCRRRVGQQTQGVDEFG